MNREYRRHLPHQVPADTPIFLTWNLKGALPADVRQRLQDERRRLAAEPPRPGESVADRALRIGKIVFGRCDTYLDTATAGPLHLQDPVAAKVVEDAIRFETTVRHLLYAWCIMANHVHVLLKPLWDLCRITQSIKGFTARRINEHRQTAGTVFWQDESYDHWVRGDEEMHRIIRYIEQNPVTAGLCATPEQWPWSSARFRQNWHAGQAFEP